MTRSGLLRVQHPRRPADLRDIALCHLCAESVIAIQLATLGDDAYFGMKVRPTLFHWRDACDRLGVLFPWAPEVLN
ncbi:MAG TPA: hypothetical protein VJA25_02550 [Dehalococcoidia bacterium]|nr:hypothetical protein [Dehalococcoidia bacterium]